MQQRITLLVVEVHNVLHPLLQVALEVLQSGERTMVSFGYSDDDAFAVGLTCGGTIHLFVEPLDW